MSKNETKNFIINESKHNKKSISKGIKEKGVIFFANNSGSKLDNLVLRHDYTYDSAAYTEITKEINLNPFEMNKIGDEFNYVLGEGSDLWSIQFYIADQDKTVRYKDIHCNVSSEDNGVVIIAIDVLFNVVIMKSSTGYCQS